VPRSRRPVTTSLHRWLWVSAVGGEDASSYSSFLRNARSARACGASLGDGQPGTDAIEAGRQLLEALAEQKTVVGLLRAIRTLAETGVCAVVLERA